MPSAVMSLGLIMPAIGPVYSAIVLLADALIAPEFADKKGPMPG
jgi:hypothetical protein